MKEYECRYCHKKFLIDGNKKAGGIMSAHQRLCESNPKRQWYIETMKKTAIKGNLIGQALLRKQYESSLKTYSFKCERCGKEYSKTLSPKQFSSYQKKHHFCSNSCAHVRTYSDATKNKISKTLKSKSIKIKPVSCELRQTKCLICQKPIWLKTTAETICVECKDNHPEIKFFRNYDANGHRIVSDATRKILSDNVRKRIANGTHNGWAVRPVASYPEKFWKAVLENNGISYSFNFPVKKKDLGLDSSACYFLDFKIGNNIDLEIDGKQHKKRIDHDRIRDEALVKNGWIVYRIPWNEINTEKGKLAMKNKIDLFLQWFQDLNK